MTFKFIQRFILDQRFWFRRKKYIIFAAILLIIFKIAFITHCVEEVPCETFDVVYTWVNGSDPELIRLIEIFGNKFDPARFDDKNELKYSLRSLQKFAPWVRHVYIVTNGQIPHWLDLNYGRVSIVQHTDLVLNVNILPTFSSSAIETFIHRIPGLSKRFLYLNDDIFLNAPLYPEDLHTESEGVVIYNAWTVPDCANDCPWVYIGDGSCDEHCNIEECQFDGGDCMYEELQNTHESSTKPSERVYYEVPKTPAKRNRTRSEKHKRKFTQRNKKTSFTEILKTKNFSSLDELRDLVDKFNNDQKERAKPKHYGSTYEKFPFESTKDVYTHSLIHTNMLLNRVYGFKARNVLAHVGFLLDRDAIYDLEKKFSQEFKITTSHRFRHPTDIQFAFLYYNFLISEYYNLTVSEIFDELDTDKSSTWSDREIRTLLARLYPLPLEWSAVQYFEDVISTCSKNLGLKPHSSGSFSTLVYERYEDSNIPIVSKHLVENCGPLTEVLLANLSRRPKYKYHVTQKRGVHSNFIMLTSNVTEVVNSLDKLRRNPRKFNCVNDNLEPQYHEENQLVRHLLEDFYLSFFPQRSDFELPEHYRNRFTYIDDYQKWKSEKQITLVIGYFLSAILTGILLKYCCFHKAKFARRYIPYKCCDI